MSTDLLIQTTVVSSCSVQCSSLLPLPPCLSQSLIFPSLSDFRLVPSFQLPPIAGKSSSFGGGWGSRNTAHNAWTHQLSRFYSVLFWHPVLPIFLWIIVPFVIRAPNETHQEFLLLQEQWNNSPTADRCNWQDGAPRGAQGSTALIVLFFFPFPR